jgi:hypothetical protein
MRKNRWVLVVLAVFLGCLLAAVWVVRNGQRADIAEGQARATLAIQSSSFANGGAIPPKFTCDGANISPDLRWTGVPQGTKSLALVMDDPDAPLGFTHWLLYQIPPETRELPENLAAQGSPHPAEGKNNFGDIGYGGPCPPGGKPHHYVFRLYALDLDPHLPPGATRKDLAAALKGHVLAEGQITGLYERRNQ